MHTIIARNVNDAIITGLQLLEEFGEERESRNGPVIMVDGPVMTEYAYPEENVLFWPERDANPFFHLYESFWMLAGKNDVASLVWFVKGMKNFSDDGLSFNGAYGYRWKNHFTKNQLEQIIDRLKKKPDDRRCVLSMWDGNTDLKDTDASKDIPCNTHAYFSLNMSGALDMTVCNRSNDVIWGAYGANAVHFSFLQRYMADRIGIPQGTYWHLSNNFHAYVDIYEDLKKKERAFPAYDLGCPPSSLLQPNEHWSDWQIDLKQMFSGPPSKVCGLKYRTIFFEKTLRPMILAYAHHKEGDTKVALGVAVEIEAADWRRACMEWLQRRIS